MKVYVQQDRDGPASDVSAPNIRVGIFLSGQHPAEVSAAAAVREHLEQVALAREIGFSSVWAGQHFLSHPFQMFQSVPLLARVTAEAAGMTMGTAILLLTLLNPVEVAETAATLAAIADASSASGSVTALSRTRPSAWDADASICSSASSTWSSGCWPARR